MEMSDRLHANATLSPGEDLPVPTGQESESAPQPVWKLCRKGDLYLCSQSNLRSPVALPTEYFDNTFVCVCVCVCKTLM
jgi:hypothetical protein